MQLQLMCGRLDVYLQNLQQKKPYFKVKTSQINSMRFLGHWENQTMRYGLESVKTKISQKLIGQTTQGKTCVTLSVKALLTTKV